jgi:predicted membrane-bound dolichyl-phosphate-mannose-protein mannosyltransferase
LLFSKARSSVGTMYRTEFRIRELTLLIFKDPAALDVDEEELAQLKKYSRIMRLTMLGITALIMATAFSNFLSTSGTVATIVLALYLLFFSGLLCCFECGLKMFSNSIAQNFGFLYSAQGKMVFLIFVAIICFQLSVSVSNILYLIHLSLFLFFLGPRKSLFWSVGWLWTGSHLSRL